MSRHQTIEFDRLLLIARHAVRRGNMVSLRQRNGVTALILDGKIEGTCVRDMPEAIIVGCDLRNYSGLQDCEQYVFSAVMEAMIGDAVEFSRIDRQQMVVSGTGDGALICLWSVELIPAMMFASQLWRRGHAAITGQDGVRRGLRVAVTRGPCLIAEEYDGAVSMQGYGLVEVSRIMGFDKGEHFLISDSLWRECCADTANQASSLQQSVVMRRRKLRWHGQLSGRLFEAKGKPGDRKVVAFRSVFGTVRNERATRSFRFGCSDRSGLRRP